MSAKVIRMNLSRKSINKAIQEVEAYQRWLEERVKVFVKELADVGASVASVKFSAAQYDGTNDVTVTVSERGDTAQAVVADGNATLFIEFGTGVRYTAPHPEAGGLGMIRGGYGHHLGLMRNGWRYHGDPGTNGEIIPEGEKHAGMVHTYGNPANMPMYLAKKEIEAKYAEIARKVFTP